MKNVIVKDFCQILFLYLVAYFVDKKIKMVVKTFKRRRWLCVSVNEGVLFVQDTVRHVVFLWTWSAHQPHWHRDLIFPRWGGGGGRQCWSIKTFFWGKKKKDKKAVSCN